MSTAIGLERKTVRLVPHDSRWSGFFDLEAALIRARLGADACDVAHVGSTAVPGLEAKPVIDVLLGIPSLRAPASLFVALAELGYEHRPLDEVSERLFFRKDSGELRTHNLSACETNSEFWSAHLRFRDCLRSNPELAQSYVHLKRILMAKYPNDRVAYTDAKDEFIAAVLSASTAGA